MTHAAVAVPCQRPGKSSTTCVVVSYRSVRSHSLLTTEQQAQQHYLSNIVVWFNTPAGVYYRKGERWYGTTKHGALVCKLEADQAGDRASLNSQ